MNDYSDIININYDGPKNHIRMSKENRAAQFASFKALSGYEDELMETRRIVSQKVILSSDYKELLDQKLKSIDENTKVTIIYFIKDLKKEGGYYRKINTYIKKIDLYNKVLILDNNEKIKIDNILDIILND